MKLGKHKIDLLILLPVILLIFASIAIVYSASSDYALQRWNDSGYLIKNHLFRVVISFFCLFFFAKLDYRVYQDFSKYLLWGAIALLVILLVAGTSVKGVNRWLNIGPLSFQPSDVAKYALILHISTLLVKKETYISQLYRGYLPLAIYLLAVCGLIALQPNFSTTLIILGTTGLMFYSGGVKLKHFVITLLILSPIAILYVLSKSYIMSRLTNYAEYNSSGTAQHQLSQAIIALGNGGLIGVGMGNSVIKEFFLPESYGDFVFAVIGEEYGFIGSLFIIGMFLLILVRGYSVVKKVKDPFGKYLALGITTLMVSYAVVNLSVASGIFPTTGVPIPFVSFGGTALILNSIAAGILLNISSFRNDDENVNAEGIPTV